MAMRPQTIATATRRGNPFRPVYEDFKPVSEWKVDEQGSHILRVHLPGFLKEQLKVAYEDVGTLRVHGQRQLGNNRWSRFNQEYPTPVNCDVNEIRAKFQNADLTVTLPKKTVVGSISKEPETKATIPPPPKQPPASTGKQTTSRPQQAQPTSPPSSPEQYQPRFQKPTSNTPEQPQPQPPPPPPPPPPPSLGQSQPSTPKPTTSLSPPMQLLPGIPKPTTDNELMHPKGPDNTFIKASSVPSQPQPSLGKPTSTLPIPKQTEKLIVPKTTNDDEITSEDDREETSDEKQAVEDNKGAWEDESPPKVKDQKKLGEATAGTANGQIAVPRKVDEVPENVTKKSKKGAEKSKVLDKEHGKARSDAKEDIKNKNLAERAVTDGLEFSNYVKHVKSRTSEARQELVNMGAAVLVIFALGTYIYNTVGPSKNN